MARITTAQRNSLPTSQFAGPDRSYPVDTRNRAANAKARASEMYNRGVLSAAVKARIDAKANAKLKG